MQGGAWRGQLSRILVADDLAIRHLDQLTRHRTLQDLVLRRGGHGTSLRGNAMSVASAIRGQRGLAILCMLPRIFALIDDVAL